MFHAGDEQIAAPVPDGAFHQFQVGVQFRIDFARWLLTLTYRDRKIVYAR
ncbi:MAG: hypothetical protein ABSB74_20380 [Tepidisphaeraceae bacterium]